MECEIERKEQGPEPAEIGTVTQITPDDLLRRPMPACDGGKPSEREIVQDVVAINPDPDTMERG